MTGIEKRYTTIDGIRIAWARRDARGDHQDSPVVFLHGLGSASREFHYLAGHPAFAHRPLLFVDAPGHGASDRPADWSYTMEAHVDMLAALLRQLSPSPVSLAGHSMGGSIAIATSTRHPDVVDRLVIAEPNLDPGGGTLSGYIARQTEDRFVRRGYQALVYQTQRQAERGDGVAARFLATLRNVSPVALHRSAVSLRAERTPTFREQLESLEIPRSMVTGSESAPLEPPLLDPSITHYVVDNAGHNMMIEDPEGFATAVADAITDG